MNKNDYLASYGRNVFSQKGEDGILEKVFEIIGAENKWCVEFGAWDGKHLSNTYNLMLNKGWSGVFIESDPKRTQDLVKTYKDNKKAICLNAFVAFEGSNTLDNILAKTSIPKSFDLLSIDIDGNDYHIWDSVQKYAPRVIIIEINPTIPPDIEFVQKKDMNVTQGSSLFSQFKLGKKKGYELVATTELNAIFVKREYFSLFGIADNMPASIHHAEKQTRLFQLYDGTIVLHGQDRLLWHDTKIRQKDVQIIPKIFRNFPGNMNPVIHFLFKVWRKIHHTL